MITYICQIHGDYTSDGYPASVQNHWCLHCSYAKSIREREAQEAFSARYRTWHHWRTLSGLPARGRNRTIANWIPHGRAQEAAQRLVKHYVADIDDRLRVGDGLTLSGPPGTGKTHLAYGIVSAAHDAGIPARYVVWPDMVERHKATFNARNSEDVGLLDSLRLCRLLVVDEIGVRTGSDFDQSLLFELVDSRYRNQRTTIVATNLTPELFDTIGERTADRLREANAAVVIPGQSQRQAVALDDDLRKAPPALLEPSIPEVTAPASVNGAMRQVPLRIERPEVWT